MPPDRIINVHTHIHPSQDIDARVKLWRKNNLDKVFVQVLGRRGRPSKRIYDNEGVLQWMRKYPDIIVGFASVDLGPDRIEGPGGIERLKEQGFTGLKFIGPSFPYDDERYYPLYEKAQETGMPILFHTGFLSIGPSDGERGISTNKMRPVYLDTLGRAFPDLKMIMAHLGNPEYHVGLDVIYNFRNIYADMSGAGGSKWRETALRKVFAPLPGADMADEEENQALRWFKKICFATDNPEPPKWIALSERLLDRLEIPPETRELFWWKNAAKILGIVAEDE